MDLVRRNAKRAGNVKCGEVGETLAWHPAPSKRSGDHSNYYCKDGYCFSDAPCFH